METKKEQAALHLARHTLSYVSHFDWTRWIFPFGEFLEFEEHLSAVHGKPDHPD